MIIVSSLPIMLPCNPATLWCEQLQRAHRRNRDMFSRCRAGLWRLLKMISPQLPGSGDPAMIVGGGKVKARVGNCLCPHTQHSHCTTTATCTQLFEGGKNKTSVILHCEFLIVLFIHPYRCFAAVIINVGNKCPPPQGGKQSCGWGRPHLGGEIKWLSSGVQVVEESKSEQRGVHLTRGRWRNTWYDLS